MAYQEDIALMAHLMRRAGFGATRDELEARLAKGYEETVEELLHPETQPPVDAYTLLRYQPASLLPGGQPPMGNVNWLYYLVNTKRLLEEKIALFWHHVFATGNSKVDNYDQLELFSLGAGNYTEKDVREASRASPAGPSRPKSRARLMAGSLGSSSTGRKTTTMAKRNFSAIAAASTARTS